MDQTSVKALAGQLQSRFEGVDSRFGALEQKTDAEFNAVRLEEAAAVATLVKSLDELGASATSNLDALRSDISTKLQEAEVAHTSLRTMDQTVVKQLAEGVEQRCSEVSASLSVLETKMLVDISNNISTMRDELGSRVEMVATNVVDSEARLTDSLTEQASDQQLRQKADMKALSDKFAAANTAIEQRIGEVEDHVTTVMDDNIGTMDRRIEELDSKMLDTIESKLDPLTDAFAVEKQDTLNREQETLAKLRHLHTRIVASDVSKATLRLASETAVREIHTKVGECSDSLLEVEDRLEPLESEERGPTSSPWSAHVLTDQVAASDGQVVHLKAEVGVLSRRVAELEQDATDGATAAAWAQAAAAAAQ